MINNHIKIQSVSDIITNSSSEVFLVSKDDAEAILQEFEDNYGCITYGQIDFENPDWYDEGRILEDVLRVIIPGMDSPDWEARNLLLKTWIIDHKEEIDLRFPENPVLLDIEDHFTDWEAASDAARDACVWMESRH